MARLARERSCKRLGSDAYDVTHCHCPYVGGPSDVDGAELEHDMFVDEPDFVDERHLEIAPLSGQEELDQERAKWGMEGAVGQDLHVPPWPDLEFEAPLPKLSADILRRGARTFRSNTGSGRAKLHPIGVQVYPKLGWFSRNLMAVADLLVSSHH